MKLQPRLKIYWRSGIALLASLFVWWFYLRSGAPIFRPWITWSVGGKPQTAILQVTRDGKPVPGVLLDTESTSGTNGEQLTDQNGMAFIHSGEGEVIGIYINHRRISLRPMFLGEDIFSPTMAEGLLFQISL